MFEKMTIQNYNEILASKTPTPGGGSALAIVATIACSLVEMSVNVTLTKIDEGEEMFNYLKSSLSFFGRAKARLSVLADEDAEAFRSILDCNKLPKDTSEQQLHRQNQQQKAYHRAALVPLDVMRICNEALRNAKQRVLPNLYRYVASDCEIGVDLLAVVVKNSLENVYANTTLLKDEQLKRMLENQGKELVAQAESLK